MRPYESRTYFHSQANLCESERCELALGRDVRHLVPNAGHSIVEEKPDTVKSTADRASEQGRRWLGPDELPERRLLGNHIELPRFRWPIGDLQSWQVDPEGRFARS